MIDAPGVAASRPAAAPVRRTRIDVLYVVLLALLLAVHAVIFVAVLVLAPVTPAESQSLALLHLPVEVARALTLPFDVLLLASLWVLGTRAAGRWAGLAAVFAVLSLDPRADGGAHVVFGPSVATGGWASGALLAAAFVVLARHRTAAAALVGAAAALHGLTALALPAFLVAILVVPGPRGGRIRSRLADAACFAGVWAIPFAVGQAVWLLGAGPAGYLQRAAAYTAVFKPHPLLGFLQQQVVTFRSWHLPLLLTVVFAMFLFGFAVTGVVRYLAVPLPGEPARPAGALARVGVVARRLPVELWAAGLTLVAFSVWWSVSGLTYSIEPTAPMVVAVVPLLTAMAYRGSKWMLTLGRFWAVGAVVYLIGLVGARSVQSVLTLIESFQR